MVTKYSKHMQALWELAGKIGAEAETNVLYESVYMKLADALDEAEAEGLIVTIEDKE